MNQYYRITQHWWSLPMGCSYPVGKPPHRSGKEYESLIWLSSKPLYDNTSGGQTTKLENISAREIVFPKISTGQTTTRFYQFWSTFQPSVWRINCECFSDHARVGGLPKHVRQRLILLFRNQCADRHRMCVALHSFTEWFRVETPNDSNAVYRY